MKTVPTTLLEGLQAFTPDRHFYLPAIFYGAGGALTAALVVELFMRAWRRWHLDVLGPPNKRVSAPSFAVELARLPSISCGDPLNGRDGAFLPFSNTASSSVEGDAPRGQAVVTERWMVEHRQCGAFLWRCAKCA
jgi:hypothetical protein